MRSRVIPGSITLLLALAGCGLSVIGTASDTGGTAIDEAGALDASAPRLDGLASEGATGADAGVDAEVQIDSGPPPCEGGPLDCCGGSACPKGTEACTPDNRCVATLKIAAQIDGYSNLLLKGDRIEWFHLTWKKPTNVTLDGVAWSATFPASGDVCNCKSTGTTTLDPPIADHPQSGAITQTDGRDPVTLEPATAANGNTLTVKFADAPDSDDDYVVTVTYETR